MTRGASLRSRVKGNFQARFWSSGGRGDSPTDCRKLSVWHYIDNFVIILYIQDKGKQRNNRVTFEQAIHKAIVGGYEKHISLLGTHLYYVEKGPILLDPLFWQALGRALGWMEGVGKKYLAYNQWWLQPWHGFIDHLAHGGSPESFFENLK
jgi:hypothetical protein